MLNNNGRRDRNELKPNQKRIDNYVANSETSKGRISDLESLPIEMG